MKLEGNCKLLKIYINEDSRYKGHALYHAVVLKLKDMDMAGATVSRGIEGYGQRKRIHSAKILDLSLSLPVIIEVIDCKEKIIKAAEALKDMLNEGLMFVADVNVI